MDQRDSHQDILKALQAIAGGQGEEAAAAGPAEVAAGAIEEITQLRRRLASLAHAWLFVERPEEGHQWTFDSRCHVWVGQSPPEIRAECFGPFDLGPLNELEPPIDVPDPGAAG